ncbi:MAG: STAS domain-containing protein [Gammaproteobacteria bacterium]
MALTAQKSADGDTVTMSVVGRFDFNIHSDFRQAYEKAGDGIKKYVIDMKGTEYMDSSALGMLLLLRDHAGGEASDIRIINSSKEIKKILEIANFNKLFNID